MSPRLGAQSHFSVAIASRSQSHMSVQSGQVVESAGTTALAAVTLLASCAVGPDFVHPAAPEITRYTREPLAPQTSSADVAGGQRQRFIAGRDIPKEWWAMFKSPALNALIERSLANNPNLQSAMATLRAATAGGLRAGRQILPAGAGQFQSVARADGGFAVAGNSRPAPTSTISIPRSCWCHTRSTSGASIGARWNRCRRSPTCNASRSRPPIWR
jgi:outer membrane protein TolC